MSQVSATSQLNASQVLILQALVKAGEDGLSREAIEERTGASATPENLGPVYKETLAGGNGHYTDSLYGLGLVRPEQQEDSPTTWTVTAKGVKVAAKMTARLPVDADHRVPSKVLDPVVRAFRGTRTYGLDTLDEADLDSILKVLPAEYRRVPLSELQRQIVNRRKTGAFSDPQDRVRAAAKETIKRCGPDGTLCPGMLTAPQLAKLEKLANS